MPLRDHFRPPLDDFTSWEGLHGQWPATIVQQLRKQLPQGYAAEPRTHFASQIEIDVATYEYGNATLRTIESASSGGAATATWAPTIPNVAIETTLPDFDEYEVLIFNVKRKRHLVAAIEIVSPANKDRPEHRNAFVAKCAALVQKGVAVSVIDLVTVRHFNLYCLLLAFIGHQDSTMSKNPPNLYAASCRWIKESGRSILQAWSYTLTLGQSLPTLPLWLSQESVVPLDLESTYEQACNDIWIT